MRRTRLNREARNFLGYPQITHKLSYGFAGRQQLIDNYDEAIEHEKTMRAHEGGCTIATLRPRTFVDVTQEVDAAVEGSGILDGHATIAVAGSGCALFVNELESGLLWDIEQALERVNGEAQVGGSSVDLPVENGRLRLGTWQRVLLVELEGHSDREISVKTVGE